MAKLLSNFRTRMNEAEARSLVITFGRFNPPTTGHEKLIKAVEKKASKEGAEFRIYPSHSNDPKKNPLNRTDKIKFMRKMFRKYARNIIDDSGAKTMLDVAVKAHKEGYRKLFVVVGAPEVPMFKTLLNKYNGVDARHGFYDFEEIEVVSAGNRVDPDSDEAKKMTADTMSASVLRKLAADGHFDKWTDDKGKEQLGFKHGVPDTLGDTDKRVLFNKVRTGMKLAAINEQFEDLFEQTCVIVEKAPPDEKIQKWLEEPSTKADFKKRYGDDWEEVMYATAWKVYNDKKGINEAWNIDDEMEEDFEPRTAKKIGEIRAKLKNGGKEEVKEEIDPIVAEQRTFTVEDVTNLVEEAKGLLHLFEEEEGRMVKSGLSKMIKQAQELMRIIGDGDELPAWAQNKFAVSADYIDAVHGYMTYNQEAPRTEEFVLEAVSKADLDGIEKYADKLFAKVGIDIEFTRHFLDRVNDVRNKKDISVAELIRLFKQTFKQYGKKIAQLGPDAQAVINDMMTDINMPFVLKWDNKSQELDLVAKTVMRKKNFMTSNPKLQVQEFDPLEEGAKNPAQQAAIAIAKKEKAGKPGYDKEGKKIKKEDVNDMFEALEWGTDESVQNHKSKTPGEVEEETTKQLINRIAAKTLKKKPYEKAAEILTKLLDRKTKEAGSKKKLKHSIEYYASEIIRTTGINLDARTLAGVVRKQGVYETIAYAHDNNMSLHEVYRPYSEEYYKLFREARKVGHIAEGLDKHLIEQTEMGKVGIYEGDAVQLDIPFIAEEDDVELNSPKRGGPKKFYVYVRNDKGNVVKVNFGDTTGLKAKINDPEARKSFVARHDCDNKKDKTTPGYWSCRLPMYAKELGLEGGGDFFW
jgi:hypothetical protein